MNGNLFFIVRLSVLFLMSAGFSLHSQTPLVTSNTFGGITARHLGPATSSGRITALEAVYLPVDGSSSSSEKRLCLYVGSAAGGVWKSKDAGTTFTRLFDKELYQSIGAITIDPRHADSVVWVGTGESNCRNSVSIGGGVYKTTDAGQTWKLLGLENVERIAKIVLDSKNPDVAYVAGTGALWSDSQERGLYKTTNGGKSFSKILYIDEKTGCADIAIDPNNPNILYASMWQFRREAYSFSSGGSSSGLFKSIDGGATWKRLSSGVPTGDLGRIIVTVSPSKPNLVYAMFESKESGLYRSTDYGESWEKRSTAQSVTARPFYFSCLYVDPTNPERVYRPSFQLGASNDGGKTFNGFNYGGGSHPDHHALWIDPTNPQHLLLGTDGGVYRSFDRGQSWSQFRNLPLAQFYHISYDFEEPYNIFGGLQDNGSWIVPHRVAGGAIQNKQWEPTGWGDGFAVIRDRSDPNIIYFESQGGNIVRRHIRTNESKAIQPFEEQGEKKLRFNWNTPIYQSPTNDKVLYTASNFVHRSTNHGDTWVRISPDLTTNDSAKYNPENSGGVTADNTSAENHCTIYTLCESSLDTKILWAGTDDGNLQYTTDAGKRWTNVSNNLPSDIPQAAWVSCVQTSAFSKGTCYITLDNHTRGDMTPYICRTTDFGQTWTRLKSDSVRGFAHVIREDNVNKNLLYVGTERGLYISLDAGQTWARFKGNIPTVPVRDIQIHPRNHDVIIATHGLGAYIIDDITPLRSLKIEQLQSDIVFLPSKPTVMRNESGFQEFNGSDEFVASNPDNDAQIVYYLKQRHLVGNLTIEIFDKQNNKIASLPAGKRKGINRISWGMSMKPPRVARSQNSGGGNFGPTVLPGDYTVRIVKNGVVTSGILSLVHDTRSIHSPQARKANFDAMMRVYSLIERTAFVAEKITALRDSLNQKITVTPQQDILRKINNFTTTLDQLHSSVVAKKSSLFADTEPQLREKLAAIYGSIAGFAGAPSADQLKYISQLDESLKMIQRTLDESLQQLPALNTYFKQRGTAEITPLTEAEFIKNTVE